MTVQIPEQVTPRIVEGVAVSANQGGQKTDLAKDIEQAMSDMVQECYNNGITDPVAVRAKMLEARDKIVTEATP